MTQPRRRKVEPLVEKHDKESKATPTFEHQSENIKKQQKCYPNWSIHSGETAECLI